MQMYKYHFPQKAIEKIGKIPMTSEEKPNRIFSLLDQKYPDVCWVGISLNIPSKKIWIKHPWDVESVKGPDGEHLEYVKRIVNEKHV